MKKLTLREFRNKSLVWGQTASKVNFDSSRLILELEFHKGELIYNQRVKRQCVKQRERQKVSLSMIRLGTKPSLPWFWAAWLRVLEKCIMICWLQLEKRLAPLPHRITSSMHLDCLKLAQVCSEASRDWVWMGQGPMVASMRGWKLLAGLEWVSVLSPGNQKCVDPQGKSWGGCFGRSLRMTMTWGTRPL